MAAKLSNIAQFCDDLSFVIARRGLARIAADASCRGNCHGEQAGAWRL